MKLFVAVVMFVMVSFVFATEDSPNPIPSPRAESQPVQNPGADIRQETHPPTATSKDLSAPINRQDSAVVGKPDVQASRNQPSQSFSQGWIWTWNEMTFLTLALVFVGSIQAYIYYRQAGLMRESLEVTRQTAKATQDSADAALLGAAAAKEGAAVARETL
jgi:hypothetical protein